MRFAIVCLCAFGSGGLAVHADEFIVKAEKAAPPADLKEGIRSLLGDDALKVEDGKGATTCIIWFRKEIPAKASAEQIKNGLTYREIASSTLIGAVELPQKWVDFRKQDIPKGVYTLRLAFQPMDGDHMGTAPYTEFCVLCPADKDVKPDAMEVKALNELSASAHGSTHPAVLLLFPNGMPGDKPKIESKANDAYVLYVKRPIVAGGQKGFLGFGMTIAGHTME